ncbi:hypothetical protein PF005_g18290 [Phytophthora fragariae]|uniref:RxLR effector protein n=2 Tax=Phytophthora TaxID=4783 RepID=A0A6A3EER4_9STRA|nr:hypothetical protein PF003_g5856 [Phytophthora fragariae]KAE9013297.1 hypothetical protein PR002_g14549 [Phytophthora rubi]KAE8931979.1 hypothetical protein PF009_g17979 [Phytophthora fragariae]KAE8993225.1 hypothetical protein PF011_g17219 [Phytophthora fragariae]KAE9019796.1 hypothetical protein PR001_g13794 [Phytophthora rubi]
MSTTGCVVSWAILIVCCHQSNGSKTDQGTIFLMKVSLQQLIFCSKHVESATNDFLQHQEK